MERISFAKLDSAIDSWKNGTGGPVNADQALKTYRRFSKRYGLDLVIELRNDAVLWVSGIRDTSTITEVSKKTLKSVIPSDSDLYVGIKRDFLHVTTGVNSSERWFDLICAIPTEVKSIYCVK